MAAPLQVLGCVMTLAAMLAPGATVVRTVAHLALDPHPHEPHTHDDLHDASTVLHGHGHDHGTPAHSHDATLTLPSSPAPVPSLSIHPSVIAFISSAFAADAAVPDRRDPSPPFRVPVILRI